MKENNFKARVVENIGSESINVFGSVGNVIEVKDGEVKDGMCEDWYFCSYDDLVCEISDEDDQYTTKFELVVDEDKSINTFSLEDIKSGMIIITETRKALMAIDSQDGIVFVNKSGIPYVSLREYSSIEKIISEKINISEVYGNLKPNITISMFDFSTDGRDLLWKRNNTVEMTIEEIKEKLGIEGEIRIKGYEESWTSTKNGVFPKDDKVVKIKYIGSFDKKEYEELGYRKHDNWYWYENDGKVLVEVIAWRNRQGE